MKDRAQLLQHRQDSYDLVICLLDTGAGYSEIANITITHAGIEDFKVHDLRHTCASRLVQNGLTIQEVAMILGHKNLSTTLRYAHHEQKQVASKMKNVLDSNNDAA